MNHRILNMIKEWDIEEREVKQIQDSVWEIGDQVVLKMYKDVNMLQRNLKLLTILENRSIPVGAILPTKDNRNYAKDDAYYYMMTRKLRGNKITDIHKNMAIASEMGSVLAKLHKALRECEAQDEFWNNSLLKEMKGWVRDAFVKNDWNDVEEENFHDTVNHLEKAYDKLPVQLIHRDVHLGNFLFYRGSFSGYLDFDLSQRNIRIFDLCYFVLGLLAEEEMPDLAEAWWFELLKRFFAGYDSECELLEEEKLEIPYVMESIELLVAAWYLEQNDIKSAANAIQIYHFVRKHREKIRKAIGCSAVECVIGKAGGVL